MPKVERCWAKKGRSVYVHTPGYTKRRNFFITLFWPKKHIVWNCFQRRRNIEFRKHLSNVAAYAKRQKIKKVIIFIDAASYHGTKEVKRFLEQHPIFKVKNLPKKDPNMNPVECQVNKRLNSAVSVNRFHPDIETLERSAKKFLRKYNSIYAT